VVLRDGIVQSTSERPFEWHGILHDMLGRATALDHDRGETHRGTDVAATLDGVRLFPESAPVDLAIRSGEVLGILGLIGAGKTEIAELLGGLATPLAGTLTLRGDPYAPRRPGDAIAAKVVLVPEDRQRQGILPGWSVLRNITLPFLRESSVAGLVRRRFERSRADSVIDTLSVVASGPNASIDDLSGGNQQKVVVGRWLSAGPALAILDEPFRGVDIAARREIGQRLAALAADGAAAVVLSSDVDEIFEVADRIVVLVAGQIELDRYADEVDRSTVIGAFLGQSHGASVSSASGAPGRTPEPTPERPSNVQP
jgi:simple sugar transport system ATP-binding protein